MSSWDNVRRATDHRATVRSGYCPFELLSVGLLSLGLLSVWPVVRRATVLSGYCLPGLCIWVRVRWASVRLGYCPGIKMDTWGAQYL